MPKLVHYELNKDDNGRFTNMQLVFKNDVDEKLSSSNTYILSAIVGTIGDTKSMSMSSKTRSNGTSLVEIKVAFNDYYGSSVEIGNLIDDIEKKAGEAKERLNL